MTCTVLLYKHRYIALVLVLYWHSVLSLYWHCIGTVLSLYWHCIVFVYCHCISVKRLGSCTGHSPPIKFITFMTICLSIYPPCSLTVSPFIHHHHYLFYPFAPDLPIGPFIHHCDYQFDPVYIRQHFTMH